MQLATQYQPDLIFLDLVLPDCNGLDIVDDLRRIAPKTTLLAVSASIIDLNRDMIVEAGCDDFLPKPIRIDDLLMLVNQYLDIEWIYESQSPEPVQVSFDVTVDRVPMAASLMSLLELAMMGDLHGIEREALILCQRSPALHSFSNQVIQLAREFEEELLTHLLQTCLTTAQQSEMLQPVAL